MLKYPPALDPLKLTVPALGLLTVKVFNVPFNIGLVQSDLNVSNGIDPLAGEGLG